MKYKGYLIEKNIFGTYDISDIFKTRIKANLTTSNEAKQIVDEELIPQQANNRYSPYHYSQYWWAVMDNTTHLYARREDGKLRLFHKRQEAFDWCNANQEKLNIKKD